jgi:catechol 1,2-dioxygenase
LSALAGHARAAETRLTEREFRKHRRHQRDRAEDRRAQRGVLLAGALGLEPRVPVNNRQPTQANNPALTAPPRCADGDSLLRSPTPGPRLAFKGFVNDTSARPVAGAEVDVWHSSPVGLYENQDPTQAEMNLRGRFVTLADGSFSFTTVKPAGYPVPLDGPTGALLRAQKRHNFRPAHLHFLIYKPGFKTIASQVYDPEDPHLETDSQFGVTQALIGKYERKGGDYFLQFTFVIEPGEARLPKAPITEKAKALP